MRRRVGRRAGWRARGRSEVLKRHDDGLDVVQLVLALLAIMNLFALAAVQAVLTIPEARYRLSLVEQLEGREIPGQRLGENLPAARGRRLVGSHGSGEVRIMFQVEQPVHEGGGGMPVELLVNGYVAARAASGFVVISAAQGDLITVRSARGTSFPPESNAIVSLITSYPLLVSPEAGSWRIDGSAEVDLGNAVAEMD